MAPVTRINGASGSNEEDVTKQYVDQAMVELRELITTLSMQNIVMNQNMGRQSNQYRRLAKVEFPKFQGEDVRGWVFKCDQFFLIDIGKNCISSFV